MKTDEEWKEQCRQAWPWRDSNEYQRGVLYCIISHPHLLEDDSMKTVTEEHFTDPLMKEYFNLLTDSSELPLEVMAASADDYFIIDCFKRYVFMLKKQHREQEQERLLTKAQILIDAGEVGEADKYLNKAMALDIGEAWIHSTEGYEDDFRKKQHEIDHGITSTMMTGFKTFDNRTGGLNPGQLLVVGAGVGHGKTVFVTQVARSIARSGKRVGIFSLEMERKHVIYRYACGMAEVQFTDYLKSTLTHAENVSVNNQVERLSGLDIQFYNVATATPDALVESSFDMGFDLVIIDHLQRVKHKGNASLNERAFEVANTAKTIARLNNNAVILLSQLSREHTKRGDGEHKGRPVMSDFRDSGMIEAEADTILMMHRPGIYDENADQSKAEWIVPKLRFGQTTSFPMNWMGAKGWQDLETRYDEHWND